MKNKEIKHYLNLASAIIKCAEKDIIKNNVYASDAEYFLNSDWGEMLYDTISMYRKEEDNSLNKLHKTDFSL
jgi:hypothetical protein